MPKEDAPQRRRRKSEAVPETPPVEFPEPGSPASAPEDRDLFATDDAPTVEEVEEKLKEASAILEGIMPPLEVDPALIEPEHIDLAPGAISNIYGDPDEIAKTQEEFMLAIHEEEIRALLTNALEIVDEHAPIALKNGYRGVYSDFMALKSVIKQLEKKAGDCKYLRGK